MKRIYFIFLIVGLILSSCSKEDTEYPSLASNNVYFNYNGGLEYVEIYHNDASGYSITCNAEWENAYISGSTLVVSARPNVMSKEARQATILLSPNKGGNTLCLNVNQEGYPLASSDGQQQSSKLDTPTGVRVVADYTGFEPRVRVTWNPVANAASYIVIRWSNEGVRRVGETRNEYIIDENISSGIVYGYTVTACGNGYEKSEASPEVTISL